MIRNNWDWLYGGGVAAAREIVTNAFTIPSSLQKKKVLHYLELSQYRFCHFLLAKESHKASRGSKSRKIDFTS